jgi:hypothetical protein
MAALSADNIETEYNRITEHYQGTCNSMDGEDLEFLESNNLCDRFDGDIFNCQTCGWWCETCEEDESGNCNDCADTGGEE